MKNHEDSNAEMYRRELLYLNEELKIMQLNVRDLQEQLVKSYKRIDELNEKLRNKSFE